MSLYDDARVVYWLRDPFWGAVDFATYHALRMLPSGAASEIGRRLGQAAGRLRFPEDMARCERILGQIRPDLAPEARRQVVQQNWANLGRMAAEMPALDRLWDSAQITLVNEQSVLRPQRAGRPILLVFPHLGHWEMLFSALMRLGVALNLVYEVLRNRFERKLAASARRRLGYRQIPGTRRSVREIYAALERREAVIMAIDEFKDGNVISPAFGRVLPKDSNIRYVLKLARRFDAAILPCLCIRTSPLAFRVVFQDELTNPSAADLNGLCESWIRAYPEQWYMLHRLRMETTRNHVAP